MDTGHGNLVAPLMPQENDTGSGSGGEDCIQKAKCHEQEEGKKGHSPGRRLRTVREVASDSGEQRGRDPRRKKEKPWETP